MEKKLTKKEMFGMVLDLVKENEILADFIAHEIDLLDKKGANKKPSKTQVENVELSNEILEVLVANETAMAIKDIIVALDKDLSNQKVSALLKKLIETEKVERIVDKKAVFFKALI